MSASRWHPVAVLACTAGAGGEDALAIVARADLPPREPRPVLRRQRVILCEDAGFQLDHRVNRGPL
jgi:hypothetical protein